MEQERRCPLPVPGDHRRREGRSTPETSDEYARAGRAGAASIPDLSPIRRPDTSLMYSPTWFGQKFRTRTDFCRFLFWGKEFVWAMSRPTFFRVVLLTNLLGLGVGSVNDNFDFVFQSPTASKKCQLAT